MIKLGQYNTLKVIKQEDHGFYLKGDEDWGDILLPKKSAPEGLKIEDEIEVFVYFDSEDVIIATTRKPMATVGEFASLKVASVEEFGVFLNWGLEKDLFVPHREQLFKMLPGQKYVVYLYVDSSDRIAASTRIAKFIDKGPSPFEANEKVELLIYQETDLGFKAIVNGKYDGLLFKDDVVAPIRVGQKLSGYIKNIREDHKLDLMLKLRGREGRDQLSEQIIQKLKDSGGELSVTAKSSSEVIRAMFNTSRKQFKNALGGLYKSRVIAVEDDRITLLKKD